MVVFSEPAQEEIAIPTPEYVPLEFSSPEVEMSKDEDTLRNNRHVRRFFENAVV